MPDLQQLSNLGNAAALVACAAAALALWMRGLDLTYRALFWQMLSRVVAGVVLAVLQRGKNPHFWTWTFFQVLGWVLTIYVVLEYSSLALRAYPGLARIGRRSFTVLLGAAVLAGTLSSRLESGAGSVGSGYVQVITMLNRSLDWTAVLFLLFVLGFMLVYSAPLNENMTRHGAVLFLYYVSVSLAVFYYNLNGATSRSMVNAVASGVAGLCYLLWAVGLTTAGERRPGRGLGYRLDQDEAARRLRRLNDSLRGAQPQ